MKTRAWGRLLVALLLNASGGLAMAAESREGDPATDPATDPNMALAMRSLRALGADVDGSSGRCASCHTVGLFTLNRWQRAADMVFWSCLDPDNGGRTRTALDRVNCLRVDPANPQSEFSPGKLGIYAAGSHLAVFSDLFQQAYPAAEWQQKYAAFKASVQMPEHGANVLSPDDFEAVRSWMQKNMPYMETILGRPADPPTTCQTEIKPAMVEHIQAMSLSGWEAKNKENGVAMFACPTGGDALSCFAQKTGTGLDVFAEASAAPFSQGWGRDNPEAKIRILRDIPFRTSYWMRSSADGRFFGNGARDGNSNEGGMISDLQNALVDGAGRRDITVDAAYDPGFFPDNSGFIFQGTPVGAGFCPLSILENPATTHIAFNEPECSGSENVDLYQAVGASLDGSDYLAITGSFEGDSGGGRNTDGQPSWGDKSYLRLVPIINDGRHYQAMTPVDRWMPYLGDWGLAPSNLVTASRVGGVDSRGEAVQMGYKFHLVHKSRTVDGYDFDLDEAATVCVKGGKGAFSYDERFYTVFHYVEASDWQELGYANANDPEFRRLIASGSSNISVIDLLNGTSRRVTHMGPGQFAMFPHYRSDGWLYFQVFDSTLSKRFAVATDAGVRMALGGAGR